MRNRQTARVAPPVQRKGSPTFAQSLVHACLNQRNLRHTVDPTLLSTHFVPRSKKPIQATVLSVRRMPAAAVAAKVENSNHVCSAMFDVHNSKGKMPVDLNNCGQDPTKIANTIIEKKIRNLEKRKVRIGLVTMVVLLET